MVIFAIFQENGGHLGYCLVGSPRWNSHHLFGHISLLGHVLGALCKFQLDISNGFNFRAIFVEYQVGILPYSGFYEAAPPYSLKRGAIFEIATNRLNNCRLFVLRP